MTRDGWTEVAPGILILDTGTLPLISIKIVDQAVNDLRMFNTDKRFFWILEGFECITTGYNSSFEQAQRTSVGTASVALDEASNDLSKMFKGTKG